MLRFVLYKRSSSIVNKVLNKIFYSWCWNNGVNKRRVYDFLLRRPLLICVVFILYLCLTTVEEYNSIMKAMFCVRISSSTLVFCCCCLTSASASKIKVIAGVVEIPAHFCYCWFDCPLFSFYQFRALLQDTFILFVL